MDSKLAHLELPATGAACARSVAATHAGSSQPRGTVGATWAATGGDAHLGSRHDSVVAATDNVPATKVAATDGVAA